MAKYALRFEVVVGADVDAVWAFHQSPEALTKLTPPGRNMRVDSLDKGLAEGSIQKFSVKLGPFRMPWWARIHDVTPPNGFSDTAEKSPFKSWKHRHSFEARREGTAIVDTIELAMPFGFLGAIAWKLFAKRDLENLFAFRTRVFRAEFGEPKSN